MFGGRVERRSQAETSWRGIQDAWIKQPGNNQFLQTKMEVNGYLRSLGDLPNEERRQIQILEQKKLDAQLGRFLDRFLIANAKINKIGSGRKAVLASFGIQTAADIDPQKISAIQGFGPALIAELTAWRQGLAQKFVFNASEPVNQNDLFALKARIAGRKVELENKLRAVAGALQQLSNASLGHRAKLISLANQPYTARKRAEVNEQAATGPLHKASKFISICCAVLAAIGLMRERSATKFVPPQNAPVAAVKPSEAPISRADFHATHYRSAS